MNKKNHIIFIILITTLIAQCASAPSETIVNNIEPVSIKEPLFILNTKETLYVEKCSCSVRKLPMESGAGAMGNAFLSNLTPESDREYELSCKGKVVNKTKYKLQNVTFQWEYLSATKFPMGKSSIREYKNNYILPKSTANISIVIGSDTGIKNYYTKEVKSYDCKVISATDTETGEIIN